MGSGVSGRGSAVGGKRLAAWLETVALVLLGYLVLPPAARLVRGNDVASLTITDRNGVRLREIRSARDGVAKRVALRDISPWLVQATVLAEDRRFFEHPGIDLRALARAVHDNLRAGKIVSGGSTITQQLVHNALGLPRRNPLLKLAEAFEAVRWELHLGKPEILEAYLNRVPYGNQTFGVEAAAQLYFGKSCAVLSAAEAALLAGIPQAPTLYDPYRFPERARKRQLELLGLMKKHRRLSELEYDVARQEAVRLVPGTENFRAPHFVDWLKGTSRQGSGARGQGPGILRTTLDWRIQEQVERALKRTVHSLRGNNVTNGAAIVMNPRTGEILALAGSADWFDARHDGQVNAALARRQPGSALKPFTYELALENGMTAADLLPDLELHAVEPSGDYAPRNYDEQFHGPVRLRTALACSYNIPAVRVLERLGPERLLERLQRLGFRSLDRDARHYGLALTLGVGDVTLLELCRAYACLANQGYLPEVRSQKSEVRTADGPGPAVAPAPVLDEAACYVITSILGDNTARIPAFGEFSPLDFDFPCAAKTGTSKDYRDNWTIGYTTEYLVGVWVGNFDATPMHGVSGITGAAPLFREIMQFLHPVDPPPFSEPAGVVHMPVCPGSGAPCSPDCPNAIDEVFVAGTEPRVPCAVHQRFRVDRITGLAAQPDVAAKDVEERVFQVYPALYYDWMQSQGMALPPAGAKPVGYADADDGQGSEPAGEKQRLQIVFPDRNSIFKLDPDLDRSFQSVQLRAEVPAGCAEVAWRVDGALFETSAYPFSCFWPLAAGRHRIACEAGRFSDEVPVLVLN